MGVLTNKLAEKVEFQPIVVTSAGQLHTRVLARLFEYWDRLRGERFAPARKEIKPGDIPSLLPHVLIFEPLDGAQRWRVRLVGSGVGQHLDPGFTGTILDDTTESLAERRNLIGLRTVARDRLPLTCRWDVSAIRGLSFQSSEVLWLPLSADGLTVDQVLASFILTPKARKTPADYDL